MGLQVAAMRMEFFSLSFFDLSSGELYNVSSQSWFQQNNMQVFTAANDVIMGICDDPSDDNSFIKLLMWQAARQMELA